MDWSTLWDWIKILVSPLVTFIAFFFTYIKDKAQNRTVHNEMEEQIKVSIQPLITIQNIKTNIVRGGSIYVLTAEDLQVNLNGLSKADRERKNTCIFTLKNIGQAAAVNLMVTFPGEGNTNEMGHIDKGDTRDIYFSCPSSKLSYSFDIKCRYSNIGGQKYEQSMGVICSPCLDAMESLNSMLIKIGTPSFPKPI